METARAQESKEDRNLLESAKRLSIHLATNHIVNFSGTELIKRKSVPPSLLNNILPTVCVLQAIRTDIGKPIMIHSAYRDQEYNASVGGQTNSLHLAFNALDFCPVDSKHLDLVKIYDDITHDKYVVQVEWNGKVSTVTSKHMGIGLYNNFIHIDTRGLLGRKAPARWNG